jgi:hypothetical protein
MCGGVEDDWQLGESRGRVPEADYKSAMRRRSLQIRGDPASMQSRA